VDLITRAEFDDLLGAFALDACDSDETVAMERFMSAHPDAIREVERLRSAAVGLAASEALAPPRDIRASVFERARALRAPRRQTPLEVYTEVEGTLVELLGQLPESALDLMTLNGLTVRELIVHLAAMESLLAMWLGEPTLPEVEAEGIEDRTAALIELTRDWALADVIALWRRSMAAVRDLAPRAAVCPWFGVPTPTDLVLVARAFETWTHTDDIRTALGRALDVPSAAALHTMAEGSMTMVPSALEKSGRARPGRTARIVLTGAGGGDWTLPMAPAAEVAEADVTLTLAVVDWCRRFSDRLSAEELDAVVRGDRDLGDDLVAAASIFASL
jgi:uncharacterized protein (TIGR03083 family)